MCRRTLVIIVVLIAIGAACARAQQADAITTKVLNGTITGTITGPVAGLCTKTGYSAICPSGPTNCACYTINAAEVSGGLAGTGVGVVQLTVDSGSSTSAVSGSTCQPAFGEADLTTTVGRGKNKTVKTETLNLLVTLCDKVTGANPETISGGFGIAASPVPSPAASGWGTLDGDMKGSKMTLKLKGSITQ
jgi:hypothetical protein